MSTVDSPKSPKTGLFPRSLSYRSRHLVTLCTTGLVDSARVFAPLPKPEASPRKGHL